MLFVPLMEDYQMSGKLQNIESISPVSGDQVEKKVTDSVQAEYEEGKRFLENNNPGQAAVALHNALIGFEKRNDEPGVANACNQLGLVCLAGKEYELALEHFQRTFAICDKSNDRMSLIAVSKNIISAYRGLEQYDKAVSMALDILDWYQDNRDPQGAVVTLELLAEIYVDSGNNNGAADAYRTAASIHKNFKHNNIAAGLIEKAELLEKQS